MASSSIYRKSLLQRLCIPFIVIAPNIDETPLDGESGFKLTHRLSLAKAMAVIALAKARNCRFIIGSDQVASINGKILGKPDTHLDAILQLRAMRAQIVIFYTGICLLDTQSKTIKHNTQITVVETKVYMRNYSDLEIDAYLNLANSYDCAGSIKIDGLGIAMIEKIDSTDPTAMIGLPLITLTNFLSKAKYQIL